MSVLTYGGGDVVHDTITHSFLQYDGGAAQTITAGAVTTATLASSVVTSTPQPASATMPGSGVIILPVSGVWQITITGWWPNVLDANVRVVIAQLSTDGGGTWPTLWADGRTGINNSSYGQNITFSGHASFLTGYQLRYQVLHSATTSLAWTPGRFNAVLLRGW